jgi:hypothetical protein
MKIIELGDILIAEVMQCAEPLRSFVFLSLCEHIRLVVNHPVKYVHVAVNVRSHELPDTLGELAANFTHSIRRAEKEAELETVPKGMVSINAYPMIRKGGSEILGIVSSVCKTPAGEYILSACRKEEIETMGGIVRLSKE